MKRSFINTKIDPRHTRMKELLSANHITYHKQDSIDLSKQTITEMVASW